MNKFDEMLKERFFNTNKFSNHDNKKSLFYCCEKVFPNTNITKIGKNLMKHHYPKKKIFSHLNMEDITDANYVHVKIVCKEFKTEKI